MQLKFFTPIVISILLPIGMQAQFDILSKIKPLQKLQTKFQPKVKADYTFTSSPVKAGVLPKSIKTTFTTAEPVYAVIKYEKPFKEIFRQTVQKDGMSILSELHVGKKKLGEAITFFTEDEYYGVIADETILPLEIIPGENTWQHNPAYVKLLENIAELEPGIITVKIKRFTSTGDDVIFTLDATNIAKDKERLLRIADRIRNNKANIKETIRQHEKGIWALPTPVKRDAALENQIRAAVKTDLKVNPTHVIIGDNDWYVIKDQYTGLPQSKYMAVAFAWKEKGECWIYNGRAIREYLGGGRYGNIHFSLQYDNHLVDCGNLK